MPTQKQKHTEKAEFDANLPGLLDEVLSNNSCSIMFIPIRITKSILAKLAALAIEIDDDRLHVMMLRMGLYDVPANKRVALIKKLKKRNRRATSPQGGGLEA